MQQSKYSTEQYLITPDRKFEQFLYMRNIRRIDMLKDETGWTYWVYERSACLNDAIGQYVEFLAIRRKANRMWKPQTA